MKKVICCILTGLMLVGLIGCGNSTSKNDGTKVEQEETNKNDKVQKEEKDEQKELDEELIKEAVKADFVKLNGHAEENKNLKVFAEGTISNVDYDCVMDLFPSFTLVQKEGEGNGMYHISNVLGVKGLKEGDYVKAYGVIDGESNVGLVKIAATVIEK